MLGYKMYLKLQDEVIKNAIWEEMEGYEGNEELREEYADFDEEFYAKLQNFKAISIEFESESEFEESGTNFLYSPHGDWCTVFLRDEGEWDWELFQKCSENLKYFSVEQFDFIPGWIFGMEHLRYLEVCGCNLEKSLKEMGNMRSLEYLNLNHAILSEIPEKIGDLENLAVLSLMHTMVEDLPDNLAKLKSLRYLGMNGTRIQEIPGVIFQLEELQSLYLGITEIRVLPEEMKNLKKLEHLALWETQVAELPDWICDFTELRGLYLGRSENIQRLPENIGNLTKLEKLFLDGTGLTELPDSFGNLVHLKNVTLAGTEIRRFPPMMEMPDLEQCDLSWMTLERIPLELIPLRYGVSTQEEYAGDGLNLYGTRLLCQPISLFEQKREFINAYYEEEKIHLNETKVVFLGDGEAGKSHIIERMKHQGEKLEEFVRNATPGIEISQENYQIETEDMCLQIWDFGGQEIMHSMHRFFLTDRTLYVIVLNSRDNTQDERAKYWLNNIKSFANGCPVILVLNKMDQNPSASLNERLLMDDYPQIVSTMKMSALEDEKAKFDELTERILSTVKTFDSYAMEFPVSWNKVKNILTEMPRNYIVDREYREICERNGIEDERIQNWLLDWFHDLGVSFNYRKKDELLGAYMVLKPQWITNAIYIILFNGTDEAKKGMIPIGKIIELLKHPPRSVENIQYDIEEVPYILGVMRRFEISYRIDEQTEFIPMMCDKNQNRDAEEFLTEESLEYFMEYEYLPNNVLHKLMIKMREDIVMEKIWLTGMILSSFDGAVSALVRMHNKRIEIFVKSQEVSLHPPREYLLEIRKYLLAINRELNLTAEDMIVYKEGETKDEIRYETLLIHLSSEQSEYFSSVFRKMISIKKILGLVEDAFSVEQILEVCRVHKDVTYPMLQTFLREEFDYEEFLEELVTDCTRLQGNTLLLEKGKENDRNTYLRDLLETRNYVIQDQTLNGISSGGKQAGELDLLIRDARHRPAAVFEALNLKYLDQDYLGKHIRKIYSYDTWGLECNYLVVYAECADFSGFCKRYKEFIEKFSYPYPLEKIEEGQSIYTDMHILYTDLQRNGKTTELVHLLVWMKP